MSNGNLFVKTLKKLHYPDADNLDGSDFEWMFSNQELKPFLDIFNTLDEDNYVSAEELEEYLKISFSEMEKISEFQNSLEYENLKKKADEEVEQEFLKERILCVNSTNKVLEKKIDSFKKHEAELLEENDVCLKSLNDAKDLMKMYEMHYVPQAENELITSLENIFSLIKQLHSIFHDNESCLPSTDVFSKLIANYLDNEKKVLENIKKYQDNIVQVDNIISFIKKRNSETSELQHELLFLQNVLEKSYLKDISSECDLRKNKATLCFLQNYKTQLDTVGNNPSVIRQKLEDAVLTQKKLKEREQELSELIHDSVSKNIQFYTREVMSLSIEEQIKYFQGIMDNVKFPRDVLLNLRARLNLLILSLMETNKSVISLKELVDEVSKYVKDETDTVQERKACLEENIKDVSKYDEVVSENSVFQSLYKILGGECDKKEISLVDILQKASTFLEQNKIIQNQLNEKLEIIHTLENQYHSLEKLLMCSEQDFANWHELEHFANKELNALDIKLSEFKRLVSECEQDFDKRLKVIEQNRNMKLARKLYVHALLDEDLFKATMEDIKPALKNSVK